MGKAKRKGWRPVKVEFAGATYELHRDGSVYERRAHPIRKHKTTLRRVKDPRVVITVRRIFLERQKHRKAPAEGDAAPHGVQKGGRS